MGDLLSCVPTFRTKLSTKCNTVTEGKEGIRKSLILCVCDKPKEEILRE